MCCASFFQPGCVEERLPAPARARRQRLDETMVGCEAALRVHLQQPQRSCRAWNVQSSYDCRGVLPRATSPRPGKINCKICKR